MAIKTVSIIGLGALGVLFGKAMTEVLEASLVRVIADQQRIDRYKQEGIYSNGIRCNFEYMNPEEECEPADLVLFCVKFYSLREAAMAMKHQIGPNTIILSLLNGISSEKVLGEIFGTENLLYCVAQGMDAVKEGNQLTYSQMGTICVGGTPGVVGPQKLKEDRNKQAVADFFTLVHIPHQVVEDAKYAIWNKFMLNVGLNQVVAYYEGDYGTVQRPGDAQKMMLESMREVIKIAAYEGVTLTENDITEWMRVLATLSPLGKPSLRQDMEARRKTEVEMFSGTVLELGHKYGVNTPVNLLLNQWIREREGEF